MKFTRHMSVNIEGVLLNYKRRKIRFFDEENGNPMSDAEARAELARLKALGHKLIGSAKCEGFDPFGGGCPGHPQFEPGHAYHAKHTPTGEDWVILGIDVKGDRVCVAGHPATIGKLSDCTEFEAERPITPEELAHRTREFGTNWI